MPDFPGHGSHKQAVLSTNAPMFCESAWLAMVGALTLGTATAWPAADKAIYVPVMLETPGTIYQMSVINGGTANGTTDIGIYDENFNRMVSSGPTTQAGTSAIQTFDVTDTPLKAGVYFLALLNSGTSGTYLGASTANVLRARMGGILEQTSVASSTLPNPAVPVVSTGTFCPAIMAHLRSTV